MSIHETYMHRCITLAKQALGNTAPNPIVGSILVYEDRIIGEGYHQQYGQAHAEVNCINSVAKADEHLIPLSTLYVSLEPCSHFGKTPPCSDLIIQQKIKKVVIGCRDPFKEVNGKGIEKLQTAGVEVVLNVLEDECKEANKRFFTFHTKQRPYVVLKWAQTSNGIIAYENKQDRLLITNDFTNRLVHKWRSEEVAMLVGTNTALNDNPSLNNRLWNGKVPTRLVIDMNLRLPSTLQAFNQQQATIIFNACKHEENENLFYYKLNKANNVIDQILSACYTLNLQSILIEGGTQLLQSFIDAGLWDEARICSNETLTINNGLKAPTISNFKHTATEQILTDKIQYYINERNN